MKVLSRRIVLVVLIGWFGLTIFWLSEACRRRHRINHAGFEAIELGMTPEEVAAALRAEPGNYTTGSIMAGYKEAHRFLRTRNGKVDIKIWESDEAVVFVAFSPSGRVAEKVIDRAVAIEWEYPFTGRC